jgi:hypothetical protein
MKTIMIIISLMLPALSWGEGLQVQTRYPVDIGKAGSYENPYVLVDESGREVEELRPRYISNPYPNDPDYAPGGRYNPLEVDD